MAGSAISWADATLQICIAATYTAAIHFLTESKEKRLHARTTKGDKHKLGGEDLICVGLTVVIAVLLKDTYPPVVTAVALGAIYFAVEHLGSLRGQETSLHGATAVVKKVSDELGTIMNRLGTKKWSNLYSDVMQGAQPLVAVFCVWDDKPSLGKILKKDPADFYEDLPKENMYKALSCLK